MNKEEIRQQIWRLMQEKGVVRFPGAVGRIPNFVGAEHAARLLQQSPVWQKAKVIKSNPDSPQRAVRSLALMEGKIIYMAVPRLKSPRCFIELDPEKIRASPHHVSSIKGAFRYGKPVLPQEVKEIELMVCGSVAVNNEGARVGKGGGYSDLEYALLTEAGKISPRTPIVTTIHHLQMVGFSMEMKVHDIPVDYIITPEELIPTHTHLPRPPGVCWDLLDERKMESIPILRIMKPLK